MHISPVDEDQIPVYLLGQIGKNKNDDCQLKGCEILDEVYAKIAECHNIIGGRIILIECEEIEKLKEFYENNGFQYLQSSSDRSGKVMLQFIKFMK